MEEKERQNEGGGTNCKEREKREVKGERKGTEGVERIMPGRERKEKRKGKMEGKG